MDGKPRRAAHEQGADHEKIDTERRLHDAQHAGAIEAVGEGSGDRPDEEVGTEVERQRDPHPGCRPRQLVHRETEQQHLAHHRRAVEERHGKEPAEARAAEREGLPDSPDQGRTDSAAESAASMTTSNGDSTGISERFVAKRDRPTHGRGAGARTSRSRASPCAVRP